MAIQLKILTVGLEPHISRVLSDILKDVDITTIPMDMEKIMESSEHHPCLVIAGLPKKETSGQELAQMLRIQHHSVPIFLCCDARAGFERKEFIKNGFTDAFLIPMDTVILRSAISEALGKASNGTVRVYRPVKLIDVQPGDILEFDTSVYLPANRKHVKISHAGDALDALRIDKLKKNKMHNIYVPVEQMKQFYEYSAKRLKYLSTEFTFSATERKEKLTAAVREIISGLFTEQMSSFESGQAMLKDCGEIVKSFIVQGADHEWYLRIMSVLGDQGDVYSHAGNVSTLAALFSMGLGIGKPEEIALAGLLHDIGISELDPEIQTLDQDQMTPDQLNEYKKHPVLSVNLIRSRKIVVSDTVTKTILQHHELYNGQGYPSGIFGDRISKEAQILSLADRFDELTRLKDGKMLMSPLQAVDSLRSEQVNDPSRIHYNPELLKRLIGLFPN